ncbi:tat (twin-arginine translocation) pathway signal sequence domain protein, partial [Yersinia pestis PY-47]
MKETNESRLLTTGVTRRKLVQTTLVGGLAMATGAFSL